MSLFFSRISKLSERRDNARFFSSLTPCLLLGCKTLRESPEGKIVKHSFFDPTTEDIVYSREKTVPNELLWEPLVGASQGWLASLGVKDDTVQLTDLYKPWVSSPTVIPLPSIGFKPSTHATEVSLSSSDPLEEGDFYVTAKFSDYQLSVCRPHRDSKWTHIETSYSLLPPSGLMYSNRDKTFYFTSSKGLYVGSLDLGKNELKYQDIRLQNQPKITEAGWEMLDKCFMSKHLVGSPFGELFFIKWYTECIFKEDNGGRKIIHSNTKRFMVFKQDGICGDFCYTEDMGDLCIFLSKSEAFCLSVSMYPGLKPNSVYYIGRGLGSYELASGTVRSFDRPFGPSLVRAPFWIHPANPLASLTMLLSGSF